MANFGKALFFGGLGVAAIGALIWFGVYRWIPLGKLPGDLNVDRGGLRLFVPITSMILLSALATLVLWLVGVWRR